MLRNIDIESVILTVFFIIALITNIILLLIVLIATILCIYFPQYRGLIVGLLVALFSLPVYLLISILPLDPTVRIILQLIAYSLLMSIVYLFVIRGYEKRRALATRT